MSWRTSTQITILCASPSCLEQWGRLSRLKNAELRIPNSERLLAGSIYRIGSAVKMTPAWLLTYAKPHGSVLSLIMNQ